MAFALQAEDLGKRYYLGLTHSGSIRELANRTTARIVRGLTGWRRSSNGSATAVAARPRTDNEFWALRDVNFDVREGEVLGVIGRNGAGKSTLLKVLSRITSPTTGRVSIHGRVASLLEVGTGFHPELTGRENIFLNGTILGMTSSEIRRKMDEIVAFAEIETFIDTPVKRYSSGMYVRLAFAVAAHLDPEILIIDEVLAVGDGQFQKKCLGKVGDVARSGRTVIFVSHFLPSVRSLCNRALWLDGGQMRRIGPVGPVTDEYLHDLEAGQSHELLGDVLTQLPEDPTFRMREIKITQQGRLTTNVGNGDPIQIECVYEVFERTPGLRIYFDLFDTEQNLLVRSHHDDDHDSMSVALPGTYSTTATIPACFLAPRDYRLLIQAHIFCQRDLMGKGVTATLSVHNTSSVNRAYSTDSFEAKLQPAIPWTHAKVQ